MTPPPPARMARRSTASRARWRLHLRFDSVTEPLRRSTARNSGVARFALQEPSGRHVIPEVLFQAVVAGDVQDLASLLVQRDVPAPVSDRDIHHIHNHCRRDSGEAVLQGRDEGRSRSSVIVPDGSQRMNRRASAVVSTGVRPTRTSCFGMRTATAGDSGMIRWRASQATSCRTAASSSFTVAFAMPLRVAVLDPGRDADSSEVADVPRCRDRQASGTGRAPLGRRRHACWGCGCARRRIRPRRGRNRRRGGQSGLERGKIPQFPQLPVLKRRPRGWSRRWTKFGQFPGLSEFIPGSSRPFQCSA